MPVRVRDVRGERNTRTCAWTGGGRSRSYVRCLLSCSHLAPLPRGFPRRDTVARRRCENASSIMHQESAFGNHQFRAKCSQFWFVAWARRACIGRTIGADHRVLPFRWSPVALPSVRRGIWTARSHLQRRRSTLPPKVCTPLSARAVAAPDCETVRNMARAAPLTTIGV